MKNTAPCAFDPINTFLSYNFTHNSFFLNGEGRRHHLINFKKASFFYHIIEAGYDAGPHSFHLQATYFSPGGTLVELSILLHKIRIDKASLIDP